MSTSHSPSSPTKSSPLPNLSESSLSLAESSFSSAESSSSPAESSHSLVPQEFYPCALTIAGSDSSGGAGIQADLKTFATTGSYGASVITALTAQNTQGVSNICAVATDFIAAQLDSVFSDIDFAAVKIGMLYSPAIIETVAQKLKWWHAKNVVIDPVMIAKSGHKLITDAAMRTLLDTLLPLANLITPNLEEAVAILAPQQHAATHVITSQQEMEQTARDLANLYHTNVLVKGGHLNLHIDFAKDEDKENKESKEQKEHKKRDENNETKECNESNEINGMRISESNDVLYCYHTQQLHWFKAPYITSRNVHGTGCTFSAAIASYLAQGNDLLDAIAKAKNYLTSALCAGIKHCIGHGHGPVCHSYALLRSTLHNAEMAS